MNDFLIMETSCLFLLKTDECNTVANESNLNLAKSKQTKNVMLQKNTLFNESNKYNRLHITDDAFNEFTIKIQCQAQCIRRNTCTCIVFYYYCSLVSF